MADGGFLRYLRTGVHLRPRQIAHYLWQRSIPSGGTTPCVGEYLLRENVRLIPALSSRPGLRNPGEFTFLNTTKRYGPENVDWTSRGMAKLWRYNLHYFDYARNTGYPREALASLLDSWIRRNPPGTEDAWEPFPLSLRIVNWVKCFLRPEYRGNIPPPWLESLYQQASWLGKNLEAHLLANHYFKNGKALVFAGMFFGGREADRWLRKGCHILDEEVPEQILPDGGHFERSPMYHTMILEDCLDLLNLLHGEVCDEYRSLADRLRDAVRRMVAFLEGIVHPDGRIPLFNDAAFEIEAEPADIRAYYARIMGENATGPTGRCWSYPDTGYFVMAPQEGSRMVIDCGPVGPDYQPGHAHCDTLSFELSMNDRRVVVDSGCCQYEEADIRRYNRGNAGHNTVTVDGEDQSEVWGAHRCARRAYPIYARLEEDADGSLTFAGAHDGYRRLAGSPVHHRAITWKGNACRVEDRIQGKGRHDIESRLHIHPDLSVGFDGQRVMIHDGGNPLLEISCLPGQRIDMKNGWYCPEFGLKRECPVVTTFSVKAPLPFQCGWLLKSMV